MAKPVRASGHKYKYSLFYREAHHRLVGYDNETGKRDQRRSSDVEEAYMFTTPRQLIADFLPEVTNLRGGKL